MVKASIEPYRLSLQPGQYLRRKFQSTFFAYFPQPSLLSQIQSNQNGWTNLYVHDNGSKTVDLHIQVQSCQLGSQVVLRLGGEWSSRRTLRPCPSKVLEEICTCVQDSGGLEGGRIRPASSTTTSVSGQSKVKQRICTYEEQYIEV